MEPRAPSTAAITVSIVRAILAAAEGTPYHLALTLSATAGLRRGEVCALRWSQVNLERGTISVVASLQRVGGELRFMEPKTDRARRMVSLPPFAVEVLRRARKEQAERRLLLGAAWVGEDVVADRGDGRPIEPAELSRACHRYAGDGVRLHDLRHAFGTALLEAGVHPKVASEARPLLGRVHDGHLPARPPHDGRAGGRGDRGGARRSLNPCCHSCSHSLAANPGRLRTTPDGRCPLTCGNRMTPDEAGRRGTYGLGLNNP
ncbi:MAG: site-specific integrase [Actinomycetota bacterium]